ECVDGRVDRGAATRLVADVARHRDRLALTLGDGRVELVAGPRRERDRGALAVECEPHRLPDTARRADHERPPSVESVHVASSPSPAGAPTLTAAPGYG